MERVLKDDAVQEKGERARMVRQPSLIRLVSFLLLSQLNSKGYFGKEYQISDLSVPPLPNGFA
jgi:hypothetical protein